MKNLLYIPLILALTPLAQIKFVKKKLGRGITVEIPKTFTELSDEDVISKYGMHSIPVAVFTDGSGDVVYSVNYKEDTVKYHDKKFQYKRQAKFEKEFIKSTLLNTFKKN